jgi:hypothetical protein
VIWKTKTEEKTRTRLEKRVATIPTSDLVAWSEQALFGIGRHLTAWQRSHDKADVVEAEEAAEALYAVVRELKSRVA